MLRNSWTGVSGAKQLIDITQYLIQTVAGCLFFVQSERKGKPFVYTPVLRDLNEPLGGYPGGGTRRKIG